MILVLVLTCPQAEAAHLRAEILQLTKTKLKLAVRKSFC